MWHVASQGENWAEILERGRIVWFARCPVALPEASDQDFLRQGLARFLSRKNVSYYPEADRLTGLEAPPDVTGRARRVLREHSQRVRQFLEAAMPSFTAGWEVGTSSYRPLRGKGRGPPPPPGTRWGRATPGAHGAPHGGATPRSSPIWTRRLTRGARPKRTLP